jgi:methyl-accepting chemotaxis protein
MEAIKLYRLYSSFPASTVDDIKINIYLHRNQYISIWKSLYFTDKKSKQKVYKKPSVCESVMDSVFIQNDKLNISTGSFTTIAKYGIPYLLIGLAGASIIGFYSEKFLTSIIGSMVFAIVSLLMGIFTVRQYVKDISEVRKRITREYINSQDDVGPVMADGLAELCKRIFPIWAGNLEAGRSQTEEAVSELTVNFADLVERIEIAVSASQSASGSMSGKGGIQSIMQDSSSELQSVVDSLRDMSQGKWEMLSAIKKMADFIDELQNMVSEISAIAGQTNLLALNASIESARAGQAGRGFTVVAEEVRKLSIQSAEAGKRINSMATDISSTIMKVVTASQEAAERDEIVVSTSELKINRVLENFHEAAMGLEESSEILQQGGRVIRDDISEMMVFLQFQDRVSQILSHVRNDINKLHMSLSTNQEEMVFDTSVWLDEMSHTYATTEQREIHSNTYSGKIDESTITFF